MTTEGHARNMPRVLVGCPTYDGKRYCLSQYTTCVKAFDYPAYDILLVDNSATDAYMTEIEAKGLSVVKGPRLATPKETIVASRNILRERAIHGGYDYFLSLEQDVVAPPDTITRLVAQKKEYVTTIVMNTKTINGKKIVYPMVCVPLEGSSDRVRPLKMTEIQSGTLLEISSAHLSCTLISTGLLKKHQFRHTEKAFDDVIFCNDARASGTTLYCDTTLKILHWPDGPKQ